MGRAGYWSGRLANQVNAVRRPFRGAGEAGHLHQEAFQGAGHLLQEAFQGVPEGEVRKPSRGKVN